MSFTFLESTTTLLQDGAGNKDLLIRTLDVIEVIIYNCIKIQHKKL